MSILFEDFLAVLKRAELKGNYIVGCCPFHGDNSPSLLVYKDGWFRCLASGCGVVGKWQTLWNKIKGQPVQAANLSRVHFQSPANMGGYETREEQAFEAHLFLSNHTAFQYYLEMRGLENAVDLHEIGYIDGWYTIPVFDQDGNYQTTVYRASPVVQAASQGELRYWCGHRPIMYAPDWRLLETGKFIAVTFGMLDALTLNKLRYPVVTTTAGANTFKAEWLDAYHKKVYILPDLGDEHTATKLAQGLGIRGNVVFLDYPEGCKDPNDFLRAGREQELAVQLQRKLR